MLKFISQIEKARELGQKAFQSGKERIPKTDPEIMELTKDMKTERSIKILNSWLIGWDKANIDSPLE